MKYLRAGKRKREMMSKVCDNDDGQKTGEYTYIASVILARQ